MTIPAKHRITVRRSALVAVALLMSASLGATAAQAAQTKRCGTVLPDNGRSRQFDIKASGVGCATARKLAGQWNREMSLFHRDCRLKSCRVRDFTCKEGPRPRETIDRLIDCRRPGDRVTWRTGAPANSCAYTRSCKKP